MAVYLIRLCTNGSASLPFEWRAEIEGKKRKRKKDPAEKHENPTISIRRRGRLFDNFVTGFATSYRVLSTNTIFRDYPYRGQGKDRFLNSR